VTRALTKGEALAAPSGRADDFSWPRSVGSVESAAVEPAVPDTAAADAGPKSAKPAQRKSAMDAYAAAVSSQPQSLGSPASELPALRVEWLVVPSRVWEGMSRHGVSQTFGRMCRRTSKEGSSGLTQSLSQRPHVTCGGDRLSGVLAILIGRNWRQTVAGRG
jgi:hypothetical protein